MHHEFGYIVIFPDSPNLTTDVLIFFPYFLFNRFLPNKANFVERFSALTPGSTLASLGKAIPPHLGTKPGEGSSSPSAPTPEPPLLPR